MKKKKLKRSIKIIIVLVLFIGILLGLGLGFNKIFNDPYKVYMNLINGAHDKAQAYLTNAKSERIKIEKDDILRETFNASFQTSLPELDPYSKYKYGLDLVVDSKNQKMEEIIFLSDYNTGKKIFDIGFYVDKDSYLMQSKYLFKQSIDLASGVEDNIVEEILQDVKEITDGLKIEDLEYLITSIRDTIRNSIDKKTLKSCFDNIKVNGKKTNVLRFDYELDKKALNEIYNKIADNILSNYELIAILSKIVDVNPDEIEKEINDARDSFTKADTFTISIYKKIFSNEIVKFNLITADELEVDYFAGIINISYQKERIKIDMSDKNTIFSYVSDNTEIINLKIKDIDTNIIDLNYTINIEENSFNGEIYFNKKKKSDNSIFMEFSVSLLTNLDGENVNFRISGDASIYVTNRMNLIEKENAVKIEDISLDDLMSIYNKGYNILKDTPFIGLYENLFG